MPYIPQKRREEITGGFDCDGPGELNFALTSVLSGYMNTHGISYKVINDIVGALENCKLEFYRRVAVPYENVKIKENGDVY